MAILLVTLLLGACGDDGTGPQASDAGSLQVSLMMSGELDPDGCTFTLDGGPPNRIGAWQSTTFNGLAPGTYEVAIDDLAVNCEVSGDRSRAVTVLAGQSVLENFTVDCRWRTRIAYRSSVDGNYEIYTVNPDGTDPANLTNHPAADSDPSWSPDGRRIAFTSDRDGDYEVYVMNADGTNPVNLTNDPADDAGPRWSPDGSRIAFWSSRDRRELGSVFVMEADGSAPVRVSGYRHAQKPVWSPDGSRIAYTGFASDRKWHLFVVNADGTGDIILTDNPGGWESSPTWSPDGSRIAFASYRQDIGEDIYVVNADGTGEVRLTDNPRFDDNPAWSPDGSRIAFSSLRPVQRHPVYASYEIDTWVMDADGTNLVNLTNSLRRTEGRRPVWSPDGTQVATTVQMFNFTHEIYVIRTDGTRLINVSKSGTAWNGEPAWSPDLFQP